MNELSKFSISELNNEIQSRYENTIIFKKFKLIIEPKFGGGVYRSNEIYSGTTDKFYKELKKEFNPEVIFDIGANIGIATLEMNVEFPKVRKIMIEPNKLLIPLIESNMKLNNVENYEIIEGIIGSETGKINWQRNVQFSVDSRVSGLEKDFIYEEGDQITINNIIDKYDLNDKNVLIKIDTQGYEERVIKGGLNFLLNNNNYYVKMEFAPFWLESQKTNPKLFLEFLIDNFDVIELFRFNFKTTGVNKLFKEKISKQEIDEFINYVKELGKDDKGWTELLIRNKKYYGGNKW